MASILLTILFFLPIQINCYSIYSKLPEVNFENINETSHLQFPHVNKICSSRDEICRSNDTVVCTMRMENETVEYRNFDNACYLFLTNMCDNPGQEYYIIEGIWCDLYLTRKANEVWDEFNRTAETNTTGLNVSDTIENSTLPNIMRAGPTSTLSTLYAIDSAFDYHPCPLSCPETYSPVCVSANRGAGKYFKFFTFINHCKGDVYYCKHYEEFSPPPDNSEEDVNSSGLSWSFCGAFRYMQFARFSEVLSSMGHYGWLAGSQRYSRILDPKDRRPGFG